MPALRVVPNLETVTLILIEQTLLRPRSDSFKLPRKRFCQKQKPFKLDFLEQCSNDGSIPSDSIHHQARGWSGGRQQTVELCRLLQSRRRVEVEVPSVGNQVGVGRRWILLHDTVSRISVCFVCAETLFARCHYARSA